LTPEAIEGVLADFRAWLTAAAAETPGGVEPVDAPPPVDLHTLLAQFTALRHEVNLQTKAVRAQQEQGAETLRQLTAAFEALRAPRPMPAEAADDPSRLLLKSLMDLYDALAMAGAEIQRVRNAAVPALERAVAEATQSRPPFWVRWFGARGAGKTAREERRSTANQQVDRVKQALAAVIDGYAMSLQRIDRALADHGLEPVAAAGRPFDPEMMEAVEASAGSGRPPGEVLAEIRRGYRRNGRVVRCALVRVAKS
jgi:molecular chaperone GrpE